MKFVTTPVISSLSMAPLNRCRNRHRPGLVYDCDAAGLHPAARLAALGGLRQFWGLHSFPQPGKQRLQQQRLRRGPFRFEVQIDELGAPDGQDIHKTGAIYSNDGRRDGETFALKPARPIGQWNEYEIRVKGQNYQVFLNGDQVCVFDNPYPGRGLPSTSAAPTYIGLQTHTGRVPFRNIRYMAHP
jgi:hypothetical protein